MRRKCAFRKHGCFLLLINFIISGRARFGGIRFASRPSKLLWKINFCARVIRKNPIKSIYLWVLAWTVREEISAKINFQIKSKLTFSRIIFSSNNCGTFLFFYLFFKIINQFLLLFQTNQVRKGINLSKIHFLLCRQISVWNLISFGTAKAENAKKLFSCNDHRIGFFSQKM